MIKLYCKSFNFGESGGNPAGVVIFPENETMSEQEMLAVSAEIGFSETAFITPRGDANYDVRFFTPTTEVELCGHATIASFYCLAVLAQREGRLLPNLLWQNTKAGRLSIEILYEQNAVRSVLMEQAEPRAYGVIKGECKENIAASLALTTEDLTLSEQDIQPQIISTGLRDVIIPVRNRETLNRIVLDKQKVSNISRELDVVGYHVYTMERGQIYTRNFAPYVGIDEECATGTSNGALAYLLRSKGLIGSYVEILQGEVMGELSKICVNVTEKDGKYRVLVGGTAAITKEFRR